MNLKEKFRGACHILTFQSILSINGKVNVFRSFSIILFKRGHRMQQELPPSTVWPDEKIMELAESTEERRQLINVFLRPIRADLADPKYTIIGVYNEACRTNNLFAKVVIHRMAERGYPLSQMLLVTRMDARPFLNLLSCTARPTIVGSQIVFNMAVYLGIPPQELIGLYFLHEGYSSPCIRERTVEIQDFSPDEVQILYPKLIRVWRMLTGSQRFGAYAHASPYGRPAIRFSELVSTLAKMGKLEYALALSTTATVVAAATMAQYDTARRLPPPEEVSYLDTVETAQLVGAYSTLLMEFPWHPGVMDNREEVWGEFLRTLWKIWQTMDGLDDHWQDVLLEKIRMLKCHELPPLVPGSEKPVLNGAFPKERRRAARVVKEQVKKRKKQPASVEQEP